MEEKKVILIKKISTFVEGLMKPEPPFDEVHKYPSMHTSYGRYIELYESLSVKERRTLMKILHDFVKNFLKVSIFRFEGLSENQSDNILDERRQLGFALRDFLEKNRKFVRNEIIRGGKDESVKVISLLKSQIPVRLPQLKLTKFPHQSQLTSFSKHLFGETNLIFAFDKGSFGGSFTMFIGMTKPERFFEVGDLFGYGGFAASFHNLDEFQKGFEEACKVIEFLTPKLEEFFLSVRAELNSEVR